MNLDAINAWPEPDAIAAFRRCCGSARWAERIARLRPFGSEAELIEAAERTWWDLGVDDWLEAFAAHPRIGDRAPAPPRLASTAAWSAREQSGVSAASQDVLDALAEANARYHERFGYIFIVCATGKTAEEMLGLLRARLPNDPESEIRISAAEQARITRIRLEKITP